MLWFLLVATHLKLSLFGTHDFDIFFEFIFFFLLLKFVGLHAQNWDLR